MSPRRSDPSRFRWTGPAAALGFAFAFAFAEDLADRGRGRGGCRAGEDADRLLASEFPERVLRTVWLASTGNAFDPTGHGMTCRTWLERISEVSTARIRQNKVPFTPPSARPVRDSRLSQAVQRELRVMAPALTGASPLPTLVDCLEHVVTGADADIGMRLLLRTLKAHSVPAPYGQYRRLIPRSAVRLPPGRRSRRPRGHGRSVAWGDYRCEEMAGRAAGSDIDSPGAWTSTRPPPQPSPAAMS
ncbi:hypothetical protein [Streptomyces sp. NBC_00233]|uniref:hypothetical protein n=1 Tax=Streptomyces sp. NBC_00233 TaxID=2975686 RepID=UPI00224D511A|nr:hypothetical protein [Streptomyces sp. NBC_00233]MCX5232793.1 hypothetical protein [Streptomyces sp. NBC_00233]